MRFVFSLITLFTFLLAMASAASTDDDEQTRVSMSLFRPWTWSLPLPGIAQPGAMSLHVRRHGPRRRAVHP
ncbi:hypothetical protein B0H11DRAFT_1955853 [Mycena galericulata]|nr:hypothetical protein B0H11DRAFT_1955853 [Mycena galericulata]